MTGFPLGYLVVHAQAQEEKEDERTIGNIAQICTRLTELLQHLKATPVLRLVDQWAQVLEAVGASERVMELLQLTPSKQVLTTPQCNRLS